MGHIPANFIDQLLAQIDIVEIIGNRISLRKAGSSYIALCPFHHEKTPSFHVNPVRQFYHCFGCKVAGNAINFIMAYDNLSFVEVVEELAKNQGLALPKTKQAVEKNQQWQQAYELLAQVARYYQRQLKRSNIAIDYLKSRGLNGEFAQRFGLGYAPAGNVLLNYKHYHSEQRDLLVQTGMLVQKEQGELYDRFRHRIMFPIYNRKGQVLGFGGRVLSSEQQPKYLNSPETMIFHKGQELYGYYQVRKYARPLEQILVVEGYLDVIALAQFGIDYAVATLGTALTKEHIGQLFRAVNRVIFCFDGDTAGQQAGWKALQLVLASLNDYREVKFLLLPEGEDPDSLVRKEQKQGFEQRIQHATVFSDFLLQQLSQQVNDSHLEGQSQLFNKALSLLQRLPNSVFRDKLLEKIEKKWGGIYHQQTVVTKPKIAATKATSVKPLSVVARAIGLLLQYPHMALLVKDTAFLVEIKIAGVAILAKLLDLLQSDPNLTTGSVLEYWRNHEQEKYLYKLACWNFEVTEQTCQSEFLATLDKIKQQWVQHRQDELLNRASSLSDAEKKELQYLLSQ